MQSEDRNLVDVSRLPGEYYNARAAGKPFFLFGDPGLDRHQRECLRGEVHGFFGRMEKSPRASVVFLSPMKGELSVVLGRQGLQFFH